MNKNTWIDIRFDEVSINSFQKEHFHKFRIISQISKSFRQFRKKVQIFENNNKQ